MAREPVFAGPPSSLADAVGGPLGVLESTVPAAAYVLAFTLTGEDTRTAAIVAVVLAALLTVARIARGQTVQFAITGLIGVAFAAYIADRTGKAENFFLPGLLANAGYASIYAISIAIRRPVLGYVVQILTQSEGGWREDPVQLRAYTRACWIWVGMFLSRLAVQLPLYLADALVALGAARVAMGLPLFALAVYLSWLVLRNVPGVARHAPPAASA
jgi:hypothetical protein